MSRRIYVVPFTKIVPITVPKLNIEGRLTPSYVPQISINPVWTYSERGGDGNPALLRLYMGRDWAVSYLITKVGRSI